MEQVIQPLNVTGATFLIQILLFAIFFIATSLSSERRPISPGVHPSIMEGDYPLYIKHPKQSIIIAFFLISFSVLSISEEFYGVWQPMFKDFGINTIRAITAITISFCANLILVAYLIYCTGGSQVSPFTPMLFTIPTLAIFLRTPPYIFVSFALFSAAIYLSLMFFMARREKQYKMATLFMTIACLALSMLTGYITRPTPIDQLHSQGETRLIR